MKKSIFLLVLVSILISCSSSDIDENTNSESSVLIKRIEYEGEYLSESNFMNFTYDGNKIVKINTLSGGENFYINFTYEGNKIIRSEIYDTNNKSLGEFTTFFYTQEKLTQRNTYSQSADHHGKIDYVHNTNGTITLTDADYYRGKVISVHVKKYYFDSVGNLIKEEGLKNNSVTSTTNITYDTKNNPFKNITGTNLLIDYGILLLWANKNNEIKSSDSSTNSHEVLLSYEYNNKNYPISCTITEDGKTQLIIRYYY